MSSVPAHAHLWPKHAPRAVDAHAIAAVAVHSLILELKTFPKPGLVSHIDSGSHSDMNAVTFRDSVTAIAPYLKALVEAGAGNCDMGRLRVIGLEAEAAMLRATAGINTHRGAIFGMGLLCAAAGARAAGWFESELPLGLIVSRRWGADIVGGPVLLHSHGSGARRRFGVGGARVEAASGFPSVYKVGLPALRAGARKAEGRSEPARVEACFALIAALEDTNLLHRGGMAGLRFAQQAARTFLNNGGVSASEWRMHAQTVHHDFVERWLSPGGSADLLAMTLFVDAHEKSTR